VLKNNFTDEQLDKFLLQRFGYQSTSRKAFRSIEKEEGRAAYGQMAVEKDGEDGDAKLSPRDKTLKAIRSYLRQELTNLEQFVLIQILDQSWKDHLYAMDLLRNSIGLQAFAEQDPRVMFKKEGYRFFDEMMMGVRDKVSDLIFRARISQSEQVRSAYNVTSASHEDVGGYGVAENLRSLPAEQQPQPEGQAEQAGEAAPVKTIVNEKEKVGRNDPCPCGSGKKYKKCCGANAA